jgi:4-hydroxy-3-polyprenylbenzoate decarboxylase
MKSMDDALRMHTGELGAFPMIVWCDDASFTAANLRNFLWVTFTRANPAQDIHGIAAFTRQKHWGCEGPLVIDARIKPHHAPAVETDPSVEKKIDRLFAKGGSLHGIC